MPPNFDTASDSDFERRLAHALRELAPSDLDDVRPPAVVPLRRGRGELAIVGSAVAVAAAVAAVLIATLATGDEATPPAGPPTSATSVPTTPVSACTRLLAEADPVQLGSRDPIATNIVTLRNEGAACVLRTVPTVAVVLPGVAYDSVRSVPSRLLPVRLDSGKTATLRIDYTEIPNNEPSTAGAWQIRVRLPGGPTTSAPMHYPRLPLLAPRRVSLVRAG